MQAFKNNFTLDYFDIENIEQCIFERVIVYLCSSALFYQQVVSIINLNQYSINDYDIIIIVEFDFDNEQKKFLKQIENRVFFIHYTKEYFFQEFNLNNFPLKTRNRYANIDHISTQFGKHVCFKFLKFCKKILILEQDMIIRGSLSSIFESNHCSFTPQMNFVEHFEKTLKLSFIDFDSSLPQPLYATNGGLFYLTNILNYSKAYEHLQKIKKFIISKAKGPIPSVDELSLTYVIFKLDSKINYLNKKIINSPFTKPWINDDAIIIHAYGNFKPWSNRNVQEFYPEYKSAYLIAKDKFNISIPSIFLEKRHAFVLNSCLNEMILKILFSVTNSARRVQIANMFSESASFWERVENNKYIILLYKTVKIEVLLTPMSAFKNCIITFYLFNSNADLISKLLTLFDLRFKIELTKENILKISLIEFNINNFENYFNYVLKVIDFSVED